MSVAKNFIYSSILTTAGYIFPLITYPYVSRVLGVTNIGICNFVDSIINYYVLFSMLGINTLGIREIASCQGNISKMSNTFMNLILLNLVFVLISGTALLISIEFIPQFAEHKRLMYIGTSKLLASFMLINWFYKGIENFKYITVRSLIVRMLYVISIFMLVKKEEDYLIFFSLTIITEFVNALINCIYVKSIIRFDFHKLNPFKYLKPNLTLGIYYILTTMYTTFNVVYLGFVTNTTEVGYYTTATKLHHIIISLFTAFTGVMLPRMSGLISSGENEEFNRKIGLSYSMLVYFSFPFVVWGICMAPNIICLISGAGYENATLPLIIIMPLVFIIGFEQIMVIQVLMPLKMDRAILINSIIGAVIGILLNLILVRKYGCVGSAIVWLVSEICVMVSSMHFTKNFLNKINIWKPVLTNIFMMLPAFLLCILLKELICNSFLVLLISFLIVVIYYSIVCWYFVNDDLVVVIKTQIKRYIKTI